MGLECVNGMGHGDHKPELPKKGQIYLKDFCKSEVGSHQKKCVCFFVVCTHTGASLQHRGDKIGKHSQPTLLC